MTLLTVDQAAISGSPVVRKSLTAAHKGSLKWLVQQWKQSSDWHMKANATEAIALIKADNAGAQVTS
jgi:hypothetical protein